MYDTTLHDNLSSYLFWFHRVQSSRRFIGFATSAGGGGHVRFVGGLTYPPCIHHHHHLETTRCMLYCFLVRQTTCSRWQIGGRESFPGQPQACIKSPIAYGYQTTNQNHPSNLGIHISNDSVKV